MDLQSFIQSGLLEAYVAGQCSAAERQDVERMAAKHPEVKAEIESIEQVLEKFAVANAIAPPSGLKDRILDQLDNIPDLPDTPNSAAPGSSSTSVRMFQALTIGFAALTAMVFWQKMSLNTEIKELKDKASTLQVQVDDCAKRREVTEPMANFLRDTDTRPIALSDDGKTYHITIFNNEIRKETALDLSGMPIPHSGKYFQAWALVEGKDPISLGVIHLDAPGGWHPLPYVDKAYAYAISEEDNPQGNPAPTIVIAIGNLKVG